MDKYMIHNLFGVEGWNIAWYGVLIGCGMLLGIILAIFRAKKLGYIEDIILDYVFLGLPAALICARLYYVVFEWDYYADHLIKIFAVNEGGLAIYGGVLGGVLIAYLFCRYQKFPFFRFLDIAIPSLVLGQIIGRWGNYINQEAFGNLITNPKLQFFPYGVFIDSLNEWHQATFFYESSFNVILLIIMLLTAGKMRKDGNLFSMYLIGYGSCRFFIEGLRADSLYLVPGIRVSQVLSLVLVILGITIVFYNRKFQTGNPVYTGKYCMKKEG